MSPGTGATWPPSRHRDCRTPREIALPTLCGLAAFACLPSDTMAGTEAGDRPACMLFVEFEGKGWKDWPLEVSVDGRHRDTFVEGRTALSIDLPEGEHTLEVRSGDLVCRRSFQLDGQRPRWIEWIGHGDLIPDREPSHHWLFPLLAAIALIALAGWYHLHRRGWPLPEEAAEPMRILFLAANPASTSRLDLEEELRSLEAELRGVKHRDQVALTARHAVRPDDLVRHVRSDRPTIVHFSGHGSGRGIILRNEEGGYTEVTGQNLSRFFAGRGVKLVVLNACYTKAQAELLRGVVKAVVGTTKTLGDVAARRFTVAFYRALGEGLSIGEAFRDGGDAVVLDNREDVFWSGGELGEVLVTP